MNKNKEIRELYVETIMKDYLNELPQLLLSNYFTDKEISDLGQKLYEIKHIK